MYIYQNLDWPNFSWDEQIINQQLLSVKFQQGRLLGRMENLGFDIKETALLETLTSEITKNSEIEGEHLNAEEVRSSVARQLGIDIAGSLPTDRHVDGMVEILLDATGQYQQPLTKSRLCHWHAALFPAGLSGMTMINPGQLRTDSKGPMQVVSGNHGRERIHFQAPPAKQLPLEMKQFISWFNDPPSVDPLIKAAIAHFWFVTLHPFEDGNGRISRVITDMALAKAENLPSRFYSMSTQIRKQRTAYYEILEHTQKEGLDITPWLVWFFDCLQIAIEQSDALLKNVLNKAKFWEHHARDVLNQRQVSMINLLFDGFKGKLTSSKWAKIMKCSQDTATRDLNRLVELQILVKSQQRGRSTSYLLKDYPINQTQ